jgi:hypothetical protein
VLRCDDADTEHMAWSVTKAWDRETKRATTTKGLRNRKPPIEKALLPLVEALKAGRDGADLLIPDMPSERDMARGLRRYLLKAGVARHELHNATPTTRPIRFHDLRASGVSWMAVRGDDPLKIQRRAGHTDLATTQRYIRLAEDLRPGFGQPFPSLPPELYETPGGATPEGSNRSRESLQAAGPGTISTASEHGRGYIAPGHEALRSPRHRSREGKKGC